MKKIKIYSLLSLLAISLAVFVGCKPETDSELGEPFDKIAGMTGTWELTSFTQQDLNNPIQETRDLSYFYLDGAPSPMRVTFDTEGTYAVDISQGKNYFGDAGTWSFDDPGYPTFLILETGDDTLNFNLGAVVRVFDQTMGIEIRKGCDAIETVVYAFNFSRVTE